MLATFPLDCGNTSITYEQQGPARAGAAGGRWAWLRAFDSGLLSEAGVRKRLAELGALSPGWDGEGADSLSETTIRNAKNIALLMARHTRVPEISPTAGDTLTFEWESDAGSALMEIGHDSYSFLMKTKTGKRSTDTGRLDQETDIAALGSLIQRTLF